MSPPTSLKLKEIRGRSLHSFVPFWLGDSPPPLLFKVRTPHFVTCVLSYRSILLDTPELRTLQLNYLPPPRIHAQGIPDLSSPRTQLAVTIGPLPSPHPDQPSNTTHPLAGSPYPASWYGSYPIASLPTGQRHQK